MQEHCCHRLQRAAAARHHGRRHGVRCGRGGASIGHQQACGSMPFYEAHPRPRDPHWRPFMRGDGHLLNLVESRDLGGFDRVRRCRQVGVAPRVPPGVQYSRRRDRDAAVTTAAAGSRSPRQAVAAMFLHADRLSRTLLSAGQMAAQSRLRTLYMERKSRVRRSNSSSHLYGEPVVEILNYRMSTTKVLILMPSPQSSCLSDPETQSTRHLRRRRRHCPREVRRSAISVSGECLRNDVAGI